MAVRGHARRSKRGQRIDTTAANRSFRWSHFSAEKAIQRHGFGRIKRSFCATIISKRQNGIFLTLWAQSIPTKQKIRSGFTGMPMKHWYVIYVSGLKHQRQNKSGIFLSKNKYPKRQSLLSGQRRFFPQVKPIGIITQNTPHVHCFRNIPGPVDKYFSFIFQGIIIKFCS